MPEEYLLLAERFTTFKKVTREEQVIIDLVKNNVAIDAHSKILDIGSNRGVISHALQKNAEHITLVDVEDFDLKTGATFLKGHWEDIELKEKFDVILAIHVWGHFHHQGTLRDSFLKAQHSLAPSGKLVLCYNSNNDFVGALVTFCKKIFSDFQYDYFDESLLPTSNRVQFSVPIRCDTFEELVDMIQVLIIVPDKEFESKRTHLTQFLQENLKEPAFHIEQTLVIVQN